uniref:Uncharacterized protein n=1 Tax=Arion vulgaris TaxID=1028688 RepID=A0A0B7BPJ3_9EUPU
MAYKNKWVKDQPGQQKGDAYYQLNREQVSTFRLRTGHNRLRQILFNKIGPTDICTLVSAR